MEDDFERNEGGTGMSTAEHSLRTNLSIVEIMQFMTHNSLRVFKKKGSRAPIHQRIAYEKSEKNNPYQKGVVFVSPSKEDLTEGKGYIVTSYETLQEKSGKLSHWTPNTYRGGTYYNFQKRIIKGHERENLKQVNVIGFDIDTKEVDLYALYLGCEELQLPRPNVLLETPRGFQCFFVLDTPFYITKKNNDFKSLRIAERLSANIRKALCTYIPVDTNCVPFGFYRIPQQDNVLDFYDKPANTARLLKWSQEYEGQEKRSNLHVVYDKNASTVDLTKSDWYHTLICATGIQNGYHSASRNNAVFTLALANYVSGHPFEKAYDELDQFNSNLNNPLKKNEFERTIKSAYSGRYKGVKRTYVEGLLELWTEGQATFQGKEGWYKFKKERKERTRSHYVEWEEDILTYLESNSNPENPFLEGSLKSLAESFGMAVSTLKEVVKRSNKLIKYTVGRGRNAMTKLTSRSLLFRNILVKRKQKIQHAQLTFAELLPDLDQLPHKRELSFPALNQLLKVFEVNHFYQTGASPPIQQSS